jgi:hypothetical protein
MFRLMEADTDFLRFYHYSTLSGTIAAVKTVASMVGSEISDISHRST